MLIIIVYVMFLLFIVGIGYVIHKERQEIINSTY